jgi:hypothetical protein
MFPYNAEIINYVKKMSNNNPCTNTITSIHTWPLAKGRGNNHTSELRIVKSLYKMSVYSLWG